MAEFKGYTLIVFTGIALDATQKANVITNLRAAASGSNPYPDRILQIRYGVHDDRCIIKSFWPSGQPTKNQVTARLATVLPYTQTQINNNSAFSIFSNTNLGQPGGDVFGGETAALAYIYANLAEWDTGTP